MAGNGTLKVVQMIELSNEGQLCLIQGSLAIIPHYGPMVFKLQYVK